MPFDQKMDQAYFTALRATQWHACQWRKTWHQQNHWPHFVVSSRHTCSGSLFRTTCWTSTDCLRWT